MNESDARTVARTYSVEQLRSIAERVRQDGRVFTAELVADLVEYIAELKDEKEKLFAPANEFIN